VVTGIPLVARGKDEESWEKFDEIEKRSPDSRRGDWEGKAKPLRGNTANYRLADGI
jgi:hypothetical protein